MTKAADIIAALLAGRPALVLERHTGMPYGWGLWLRALPGRLGAIRRDGADQVVDVLLQRPVVDLRPRAPAMNRWQAFRSLFHQDWDPPLREERGLRWFAGTVSVLMHLLFVLLLVLLALVNLPPPPPPAAESSRVQVEFIGEGTPLEEGGGPPAQPAESSEAAAAAQPSPAAAVASTPVPPAEVSEPAPAVAQQNVQVTETPVPTTEFVVPPTTAKTPQIALPQIKATEVTVVQAPQPVRAVPQREVVPQVSQTLPEVRQREVATPLPQVRTVQIPTRAVALPEVRASRTEVTEREVTMPNRGSASSSTRSNVESPASSGASAQTSSAAQGTQPAASATGSATTNSAGATPTPRRGDDWGDSTRNTPGQAGGTAGTAGTGPGLFNADGSARVPENISGGATARPGAPGSRQQQQAAADRANKWLERPEYPYEPTMFDKYWVPNESVLAEWVRRAIREVEVPIPGTSKKVKCVVSVLQAGGACGLYDPNLNNQPASARPPPDIPVKRNPIPTDS